MIIGESMKVGSELLFIEFTTQPFELHLCFRCFVYLQVA